MCEGGVEKTQFYKGKKSQNEEITQYGKKGKTKKKKDKAGESVEKSVKTIL